MIAKRPRRRATLSLAVGVVWLGMVACGSGQQAGSAPHAGIEGVITLDACPPAQQATTCAPRPFIAQLEVLDASGHRVGKTVRSDASGRFRVDLAPGGYTLVPLSPRPNVPPVASRRSVTVTLGRHTIVNITYDSGIS